MTSNQPDNQDSTALLASSLGHKIAFQKVNGGGPSVVWLGGFKSDMTGTKAQVLSDMVVREGFGFVRFDYFGHGESAGPWDKARVSLWKQDVLDVIDHLTEGPLVLVGSRMGAWMTCLAVRERLERIMALGFIAPAPDFTHELMLPGLEPEQRRALETSGAFVLPGYDAPTVMSQALFDDAKAHLIFAHPLEFAGKVRILHGLEDEVVPWQYGVRLAKHIQAQDVHVTLVRTGDHRLSSPQDLELLIAMVKDLRRI